MALSTDFSIAAILDWQPAATCSSSMLTTSPASSTTTTSFCFSPWSGSSLTEDDLVGGGNEKDVLDKSASQEPEEHSRLQGSIAGSSCEDFDDSSLLPESYGVWRPASEQGDSEDDHLVDRLRVEPDSSVHSLRSSTPADAAAGITSPHPLWTQRQRRGGGGGIGRRPYSRSCVLALGWWYAHLPYLATAEMEALGRLTALSRHQVKVWWQNRRHSQRTRSHRSDQRLSLLENNANLAALSLPRAFDNERPATLLPPPPQSGQRAQLFTYLLQFFCAHVLPRLPPLSTPSWSSLVAPGIPYYSLPPPDPCHLMSSGPFAL